MKISNNFRRAGWLVAGLSMMVALASCGSGGSNDNGSVPPPVAASNTPPASASTDIPGFIAFMKMLVATQDNTGSGLDISAFVPPVSDTATPDLTI